ncbi:MAG: hypothetical protein OEY56_07660, partial [Cyclobacteriaceae bacterium]|nr:hypothetical protein [Cyclobacteriaceae bacterium]
MWGVCGILSGYGPLAFWECGWLALSDRGYPSSAVSFLADASAKPNGKDAAAAGAGLQTFG